MKNAIFNFNGEAILNPGDVLVCGDRSAWVIKRKVGQSINLELLDDPMQTPARLLTTIGYLLPGLRVGSKVRVKRLIERYPHFDILPGQTGVVDVLEKDSAGQVKFLSVKFDELIEGAEEWDNCLIYDEGCEDIIDIGFDLEVVSY
jgi:hypothetical protein